MRYFNYGFNLSEPSKCLNSSLIMPSLTWLFGPMYLTLTLEKNWLNCYVIKFREFYFGNFETFGVGKFRNQLWLRKYPAVLGVWKLWKLSRNTTHRNFRPKDIALIWGAFSKNYFGFGAAKRIKSYKRLDKLTWRFFLNLKLIRRPSLFAGVTFLENTANNEGRL